MISPFFNMRNPMTKHHSGHSGFSLLELLVVVAIVGFLAAVAYPSYVKQVEKGKRNECRAGLLRTMQQQERYFTQQNTYVAFAAGATSAPMAAFSGDGLAKSACTIKAEACGSDALTACVLLTAQPVQADSRISALYLDSRNNKQCALNSNPGTKITDTAICWP